MYWALGKDGVNNFVTAIFSTSFMDDPLICLRNRLTGSTWPRGGGTCTATISWSAWPSWSPPSSSSSSITLTSSPNTCRNRWVIKKTGFEPVSRLWYIVLLLIDKLPHPIMCFLHCSAFLKKSLCWLIKPRQALGKCTVTVSINVVLSCMGIAEFFNQ